MNTKNWQIRYSKGFTLIELLVVISIIALLLSIVAPSLQRARKLGQRVACLSNLRQIGLAVRLYAEDFDGYAAIGYPTSGSQSWFIELNNYVPYKYRRTASDIRTGTPSIWQCPGNRGKYFRTDVYGKYGMDTAWGVEYIKNEYLVRSNGCKHVKLDMYQKARIFFAGDSIGWDTMIDVPGGETMFGDLGWVVHDNSCNFLWGDLSVKTMRPDEWDWKRDYGAIPVYTKDFCNPPLK